MKFYFFYVLFIHFINATTDPELFIDTSNWIDPNDPMQLQYVSRSKNGKCDCIDEIRKLDNTIYELEETLVKVEARKSRKDEDFTKQLLNDMFYKMNINPSTDEHVYKSVYVTLTKDNLDVINNFLKESEPTESSKSFLKIALENFIIDVGEKREHWMISALRRFLPYLAGINVVFLFFLFFYFNIFRSRKLMLLMIFSGFVVNEVVTSINRKHKETLARIMASESRRGKNVCEPKSYFMTVVDYTVSSFVKTEDECYNVYRESLVEAELDTKILATVFNVIGEMFGTFFEGLFGPIGKAVENYFATGTILVIWLKFVIFIIGAIVLIICLLKFCQFEIEIPFVKLRWSIGQKTTKQQNHVHNYQQSLQQPIRQPQQFIELNNPFSLPQQSKTEKRTRSKSLSSIAPFIEYPESGIDFRECDSSTNSSISILSPNITPRSEARQRRLTQQ